MSEDIFTILSRERIENEERVSELRRKIEQCDNEEDREYYETLKMERLERL